MKTILTPSALTPSALACASLLAFLGPQTEGIELSTDYTLERTLRFERETSAAQETTDMEMERDGVPVEPPERPGDRGGRSSQRTVVWLDTVTEQEDGVPTRVERSFETAQQIAGEGGEAEASEVEGESVVLTAGDDGEVLAEADGVDPERFEGQRLTLPLDALLPEGEVEPGDSWEIEPQDLLHALGVDAIEGLFPEPEIDWEAMRGRRGERGERGERPSVLRRDASLRLLRAASWDATATLAEEELEFDGETVVVIELALEGEGELEDARGPGRGRGGRGGRSARGEFGQGAAGGTGWLAPALAPVLAPALAPALATDFELELEGRLLFSVEAARPVALELEGTFLMETESVRDMGDSVFSMYNAVEGTFEQAVRVTVEE